MSLLVALRLATWLSLFVPDINKRARQAIMLVVNVKNDTLESLVRFQYRLPLYTPFHSTVSFCLTMTVWA